MTQPASPSRPLESQPASTTASPRPRVLGLARASTAVAIVLLPLATLSAQTTPEKKGDPNKIDAPQPRPPAKPASTLAGMASALLMGALVIGVNFIPSKRGHQD